MMCGMGWGDICDVHGGVEDTSIQTTPHTPQQPQQQRGSSGGIVTRERRRGFGGACGAVSGGWAGLGLHRPAPVGGSGGTCVRACVCVLPLWAVVLLLRKC